MNHSAPCLSILRSRHIQLLRNALAFGNVEEQCRVHGPGNNISSGLNSDRTEVTMPKGAGPQGKTVRSAPRTACNQAIDFQRYVPTVVSRLSMKLRASAKSYFQERYDVTLLDWRILSFLASNGPASAYDIWTLGSLDKAAVSRALKNLDGRGLIKIRDVPNSARRRTLVTLSKAGRQLHDRMFDDILIRHERLVGELSRQQIETFVKTVEYLETRISQMDKHSELPPSDYNPAKSTRE